MTFSLAFLVVCISLAGLSAEENEDSGGIRQELARLRSEIEELGKLKTEVQELRKMKHEVKYLKRLLTDKGVQKGIWATARQNQ